MIRGVKTGPPPAIPDAPAPPAPRTSSRPRTALVFPVLVLLAAGLAVYGNALRNAFVLDDRILILNEERVQRPEWRAIFGREYWPGPIGNRVYRPLTLLSLAGNWAISHRPWSFRLPNLLVHVAAAIAVFLLLHELTGRRGIALAAGLLFVVHPIHTTPLNQVIDRADIAAAAGALWATWLCARDLGPAGPRWWRPAFGAVLFAAALLFKESALALVGILPVVALARRVRAVDVPRFVGRWVVPALFVLGAYLGLRIWVLGGISRPASAISPLDNIIACPEYGLAPTDSVALARWGTPLAVFGRASRLLLWPWPLSWDYSYAAIDSVRRWADGWLWTGVLALAVCACVAVLSWRRQRSALCALGLALAAWAIVSNTLMVIGAAFAERFLYLPSAGFCMLAACIVPAASPGGTFGQRRWLRPLATGGLALAILACGAATVIRNRDFADNPTLNAADVRTQPRSARLWAACAADALNVGDTRRALECAAQAIAITPVDGGAWRIAARAQWSSGEYAAAQRCVEQALALGGGRDPAVVLVAGDLYKRQGDYARAISVLEAYVGGAAGGVASAPESAASLEPPRPEDLLPDAPTVYNNLAWYLLTATPPELRDPARALRYAERALELDGRSGRVTGDYLDTYVSILEALGRRAEARRALETNLPRLDPNDPQRTPLERRRDAL